MMNKLIIWFVKSVMVFVLMIILGTIATCGTILQSVGDLNGSYMILGVIGVFFAISLSKF